LSAPKPGDEWIAYLVDVLAPLGAVRARRFFGGHGFVVGDVQFAFVSQGTCYLRADAALAAELESLGSEPFRYRTRLREVRVASYWSLPQAELDDEEALVRWGARALRVAGAVRRKASPKAARARRATPAR
jgi:DNA transformation protein